MTHAKRTITDQDNDKGVAKNTNNIDMTMDANQQWLKELLKSNDNMDFGRNDDPYGFSTSNAFWSNFPFPSSIVPNFLSNLVC